MARAGTVLSTQVVSASGNTRTYIPQNNRKILCVAPKYGRSFGTFHHVYKMMPNVRAFMPPQGMLLIAAYLPKQWEGAVL